MWYYVRNKLMKIKIVSISIEINKTRKHSVIKELNPGNCNRANIRISPEIKQSNCEKFLRKIIYSKH